MGSIRMIFLASTDHIIILGNLGKCNFLIRSTLISHECTIWKRPFLDGGFSPSLMNWMDGDGLTWALFFSSKPVLWGPCCGTNCIFPCQEQSYTLPVCAPSFLPPHINCTVGPPSFITCADILVLWGSCSLSRVGKKMQNSSSLQSLCFGISHFVQVLCNPSLTALALLFLLLHLSFWSAFPQWGLVDPCPYNAWVLK